MDGADNHERIYRERDVLLAQLDVRMHVVEEWKAGLEDRLERKYVSANEWNQWRWMLTLMVGSAAVAIGAALWRLILK